MWVQISLWAESNKLREAANGSCCRLASRGSDLTLWSERARPLLAE